MAKIRTRISKPYRRLLYVFFMTSWCSGILFFILSRFIEIEGDFGMEKHPLQFPVLKIHGAAAFAMMISFGGILAGHLTSSWKTQRSRKMGLTLIVLVGSLILSAWLLYYLSGDDTHTIVGNIHAAIGFTLPVILALHIISGRRQRRRQNSGKIKDQPAVPVCP